MIVGPKEYAAMLDREPPLAYDCGRRLRTLDGSHRPGKNGKCITRGCPVTFRESRETPISGQIPVSGRNPANVAE